jgi:mono/diheme cytochrome c family protein
MMMKSIRDLPFLLLLSLTVAAGAAIAANQDSLKPTSTQTPGTRLSEASKEEEIQRGHYLVEEVARCPDCHTPRDSNGDLDRSKWLQGASVWISPVRSRRVWAMNAPALAGFVFNDKQGQDILERGIGTNGVPVRPPMHAYNLHHEDALAIIAYLRSLRPAIR